MLFETETKITFDEFKKMGWCLAKKDYWIRVAIMYALIIAALSWSLYTFLPRFSTGVDSFGIGIIIFYVLGLIFVPFFYYYRIYRGLHSAYWSNKRIQDNIGHYRFYEDRIETSSKLGNSTVRYEDFYRVIETKENFYLCAATNQALIVIKNNCSDGLISFLHEKVTK